jgi:hypothetical protein
MRGLNSILNYGSSDSESDISTRKILKQASSLIPKISLNPDVDIKNLVQTAELKKKETISKIYNENKKNNHLSGQADIHFMNDFNFNEQFLNFQNYGFAFDPTVNTNKYIINNNNRSKIIQKSLEEAKATGKVIYQSQYITVTFLEKKIYDIYLYKKTKVIK